MSTFFVILFFAFIAWAIASVFYHVCVKPILCDWARFGIFAFRDDLRRMASEKEIDPSSFQYRYLESVLCRLVERCSWYSWGTFLEFLITARHAKPSAEHNRFVEKANPELVQIHQKALNRMLFVILFNSPVVTIVVFGAVMAAALCGYAWKQTLEWRAKLFIEEPQNGLACAH